MTSFAMTGWMLWRQHELVGAGGDDEKNRGEETEKNGDGVGFIARLRSKEKPRSSLPLPA